MPESQATGSKLGDEIVATSISRRGSPRDDELCGGRVDARQRHEIRGTRSIEIHLPTCCGTRCRRKAVDVIVLEVRVDDVRRRTGRQWPDSAAGADTGCRDDRRRERILSLDEVGNRGSLRGRLAGQRGGRRSHLRRHGRAPERLMLDLHRDGGGAAGADRVANRVLERREQSTQRSGCSPSA